MDANKTITVAMPSHGSESVLDPSQLWLADRYVLMDNIVAKLVHVNAKNDYDLLLAENISVNETGTEISIRIREAHFSNSSLITAKDVVNSFKRLILKGSAHIPIKDIILGAENLSSIDQEIEGLIALDEKNLTIRLKQRTKEIFYYFSLADMGILHKSVLHRNEILRSDWNIVSGAYTIEGDDLVWNKKFFAGIPGMPQRVRFVSPPTNGTQKDLNKFDIGYSGFIDKSDNHNTTLISPYKYTSANYNNITYLVLNTQRPIFKDLKLRQKIHKMISQNFFNENKFSFFRKANQFFLPDSFAFQKSFNPATIIPDQETEINIPDFTVLATVGTKKWAIPNLDTEISAALKNKTNVSFTDDISIYKSRKMNRDFDAYLVPTSMSYNVVTESLNLLYRSNVRFGNNPNGKIVNLIERYQKSQGSSPEIIEQIVTEMTLESEIIPLLYVSSPKFYNSERLDISDMNTAESLTFWKIRVK